MRLLTKITFLYLVITVFLLGIGGVLAYRMIKSAIDREQQYSLFEQWHYVKFALKDGVEPENLVNEKIEIYPFEGEIPEPAYFFSDTMVFHHHFEKLMPSIKLTLFWEDDLHQKYRVSLHDQMVEEEDIYQVVRNSLLWIFVLLALGWIVLARVSSAYIFRPFNNTLEQIRTFRLQDGQAMNLPKSTTREIDRLNAFIQLMTHKVQSDYQALKEFTENASHEMQTPLAIVRGKLDLLLESPNLTDEQLQLLVSAQQALHKLSRMGRSLTLLAKLDNKEFTQRENIDLSALLDRLLVQFKELAELRGLTIQADIQPEIEIESDPMLMDILISNLLQNAIRHNDDNGIIRIQLAPGHLIVENSGPDPQVPTEQLFERFRKTNQSSQSIGLGLAIVQKICQMYNWGISYHFSGGLHRISCRF
ncbi:HAMP domain-containing sensor histidine kinase [Pontibacter sp. G13]|uniref:sensor histidine kinase n=1 Tax=Pontibacter sp. G13 TaxID=3074898 RepID=UPI00288C00B7|nr:HAMP domain-containing sensor histidine kinase [Pontibacter sp. G13]WNJ19987.1 HAMP domain-containing sensor histidine kinase [Pontibacter sp. G13]